MESNFLMTKSKLRSKIGPGNHFFVSLLLRIHLFSPDFNCLVLFVQCEYCARNLDHFDNHFALICVQNKDSGQLEV